MKTRKKAVKRIGMFFDGRNFEMICQHYERQGLELDLTNLLSFVQYEVSSIYGSHPENYPINVAELHIGLPPGQAGNTRFRDMIMRNNIKYLPYLLIKTDDGDFEEKRVDDALQNSARTAIDKGECEILVLVAGDQDFVPFVETVRKYKSPPDIFLCCWRNDEAGLGVAQLLIDSVTETFDIHQIIQSKTSKNPLLHGLLKKREFPSGAPPARPNPPPHARVPFAPRPAPPHGGGGAPFAPRPAEPQRPLSAWRSPDGAGPIAKPAGAAQDYRPRMPQFGAGAAQPLSSYAALRARPAASPDEVCRLVQESLRECQTDENGWVEGKDIGSRMKAAKGFSLVKNGVKLKDLVQQYPDVFEAEWPEPTRIMMRLRNGGGGGGGAQSQKAARPAFPAHMAGEPGPSARPTGALRPASKGDTRMPADRERVGAERAAWRASLDKPAEAEGKGRQPQRVSYRQPRV